MAYTIEFRPTVLKSLKRFPKRDLVRIKKKIDELAINLPDPNITKMKGDNAFHKIRSGNYRIIYEIRNERLVILIVKIGHRKDVYKNSPERIIGEVQSAPIIQREPAPGVTSAVPG